MLISLLPLLSSPLPCPVGGAVDLVPDFHELKCPFLSRLTVDLSAGQELVFHLNPRFKDEVDGMVTVMNSRLAQQWGTEERDRKHFPFVPGQRFQVRVAALCHWCLILSVWPCVCVCAQIKIQCTSQGFKVQVNNHDLPIFKHRTNPGSVDTLSIDNDLSLIDVFVNWEAAVWILLVTRSNIQNIQWLGCYMHHTLQ